MVRLTNGTDKGCGSTWDGGNRDEEHTKGCDSCGDGVTG